MNQWFIGTIGFSYKDWVGNFYPAGTTQRGYLSIYNHRFNSVEIDSTFHAIPRQSSVLKWFNSTQPDFKFSFKTPKIITHQLELIGADAPMLEFLETLRPMGQKLGPILIQLPPSYTQENIRRLESFIDKLPEFFRYAVEFRHISWFNEYTTDLLKNYRICWVSIDYPRLPKEIIPTTDFLYIRWIGINNYYHIHTHERVDKTRQLNNWLEIIAQVSEQVEILYGYFNNDYAGFAAGTAIRFMKLAGINNINGEIPEQKSFL